MIKFFIVLIFIVFLINLKVRKRMIYNLFFFIGFIYIFLYINNEMGKIRRIYLINLERYSLVIIILRIWIVGLIIMSLENCNESIKKINIFYILLIVLLLFFRVRDLIIFYLMFEIRLIPTL